MPRSDAPARLFIDSGAWLAYFSARDGRHAEADRLFREAIRRKIPLITTNLVLAEVQRLLLFRAGIQPAAKALSVIDASPSVMVRYPDAATHREALGWLARLADQPLSYTDAASFAIMKASRCQHAFSFNHHFAVAGYLPWRGGL